MVTFRDPPEVIPRIQKYSQKLDNLTLLINQHWVVVDEIANSKTVYIMISPAQRLFKNTCQGKTKTSPI